MYLHHFQGIYLSENCTDEGNALIPLKKEGPWKTLKRAANTRNHGIGYLELKEGH